MLLQAVLHLNTCATKQCAAKYTFRFQHAVSLKKKLLKLKREMGSLARRQPVCIAMWKKTSERNPSSVKIWVTLWHQTGSSLKNLPSNGGCLEDFWSLSKALGR